MEENKPEKVTVTLNPDAVLAPLLTILSQSSSNALLGIQLSDCVDEQKLFQYGHTEETFFRFQTKEISTGEELLVAKNNFKLWILQKGFEDLIKGINLLLIEAYFYVSIIKRGRDLKTLEDLQNEINQLKDTAFKQSLPGLLAKVEPELMGELLHISKISSLNKVRNCLVHRNSIVTDQDINDKESKQLKVELLKMVISIETDGKENEAEMFSIIEGNSKIKVESVDDIVIFKIGDQIQFNYKKFNDLLTTCYFFGLDLIQKLPKLTE